MQRTSSAGKPTIRHQSMPTNLDRGCASPWPNYSLKPLQYASDWLEYVPSNTTESIRCWTHVRL